MQLSIILFEIMMAVLFIIMLSHAKNRGKSFVIELLVAVFYGVLLEILTMIQLKYYTYGDFLVKIYGAPIAIGIGWSVIIYSAMVTVERLEMPQKVRPFMAALLALNIDLSMDAIAIRQGFWTWGEYGLWFGVPLGNFFAWFIVVFSFSYFIYHFRENKKFPDFYPVISMVLSIIVLLILDGIWFLYLTQTLRIAILVSMLIFSICYVVFYKGRLKKDNVFDWKNFSIPFSFHTFFLMLLLVSPYSFPALVLISASMLVIGLYIHFYPFAAR